MVGSKWLLDTNAIIALQHNNPALTTLLANQRDIFVPSIAIGELFFGAYKSARAAENRLAVIAFAAGRVILQPDVTTGDFYGQVKYSLRLKGRPIPENDIWIAALAMQFGCILLTDDAHFAKVDGLKTQGWQR